MRGWGRSEVEDEVEKVNRDREQHLHFTVEETASGRKTWLSLTSIGVVPALQGQLQTPLPYLSK